MLLSNERIISLLNSYCVNVNVDKNDPQEMRAAAMVTQDSPVRFYLLSPAGKLLGTCDDQEPAALQSFILRHARDNGVNPGEAMPASLPPWRTSAAEDSLAFVQTARFLPVDGMPASRYPSPHGADDVVPSSQQLYYYRMQSPTMEYLVLDAAAWRRLLPPSGRERAGESYAVDREIAAQLLWRCRPPTHYSALSRSDVTDAALRGRIVSNDGRLTVIALDGHVKARTAWGDPAKESDGAYWAESKLTGYLCVDSATHRITRVRMATESGIYRGEDGTCLPFKVILYAVRRNADGTLGDEPS